MTEWASKKYNEYYTAYVPWLEDKYLAWFGENKTSYTAKGIPLSPRWGPGGGPRGAPGAARGRPWAVERVLFSPNQARYWSSSQGT